MSAQTYVTDSMEDLAYDAIATASGRTKANLVVETLRRALPKWLRRYWLDIPDATKKTIRSIYK